MESVLFSNETQVWHLVLPSSHQAKQLGVPSMQQPLPPSQAHTLQPFQDCTLARWHSDTHISKCPRPSTRTLAPEWSWLRKDTLPCPLAQHPSFCRRTC